MPQPHTTQQQTAVQDWLDLAETEVRQRKMGLHQGAAARISHDREETYRRTARSMELQEQTGIAHCTCCLKPTNAPNAIR